MSLLRSIRLTSACLWPAREPKSKVTPGDAKAPDRNIQWEEQDSCQKEPRGQVNSSRLWFNVVRKGSFGVRKVKFESRTQLGQVSKERRPLLWRSRLKPELFRVGHSGACLPICYKLATQGIPLNHLNLI